MAASSCVRTGQEGRESSLGSLTSSRVPFMRVSLSQPHCHPKTPLADAIASGVRGQHGIRGKGLKRRVHSPSLSYDVDTQTGRKGIETQKRIQVQVCVFHPYIVRSIYPSGRCILYVYILQYRYRDLYGYRDRDTSLPYLHLYIHIYTGICLPEPPATLEGRPRVPDDDMQVTLCPGVRPRAHGGARLPAQGPGS